MFKFVRSPLKLSYFLYALIIVRTQEPMIMRTVCSRSVHITAESPPAMVNTAAMARRMRMLA